MECSLVRGNTGFQHSTLNQGDASSSMVVYFRSYSMRQCQDHTRASGVRTAQQDGSELQTEGGMSDRPDRGQRRGVTLRYAARLSSSGRG